MTKMSTSITTMKNACDIFVSGGGIAGLTAAVVFGTLGFNVICCDPAHPVTDAASPGTDMRTTALLQPARALLMQAVLWDTIAPHTAALEVMQIIDAGDSPGARRVTRAFKASDLSDLPFGWNVPNWRLRQILLDRIAALPSVTFHPGIAAVSLFTRTAEAVVTLSDQSSIRAKLVIAADGRSSPIRAAAGIGVTTYRYGQKALAFAITHPEPHENISTEVHKKGGPFTLVPLPDKDGQPCSAVVWMDDGAKSVERLDLGTADFEAQASERSTGILGPLSLASRRSIWPIISQKADTFSAERVALIAEAAHVVPPIGAQGLNMSLTDIRTLRDAIAKSPHDPGDADVLKQYNRARTLDIGMRVAGIDFLNRTSQTSNPLMRAARSAGLRALYEIKPMRQTLMKMWLG